MTQQDIDRMKELQAVDILEALEGILGHRTLSAWRVNGSWYASIRPLRDAPSFMVRDKTLQAALAQLAQSLVADPGHYDHESDTREPEERVAL